MHSDFSVFMKAKSGVAFLMWYCFFNYKALYDCKLLLGCNNGFDLVNPMC